MDAREHAGIILEFMRTNPHGGSIRYFAEHLASLAGLTFKETKDAMEKLYADGMVNRSPINESGGGYVYWLAES